MTTQAGAVELGVGFEKGAGQKLEGLLGGILGPLASRMQGGFKQIASTALGPLGFGAGIAGIGAGLLDLGNHFHSAFATIQVDTGATGGKLKGLEGDFKALLATRPENMQVVAQVIGEVNQKLGDTGKPLQEFSRQLLQLSGITKTDVASNLSSLTGLFNNWGISVADQVPKTNELFRVFQSTGAPVNTLASAMATLGPKFRDVGLTFEQSAALIGEFTKAGLPATGIGMALTKVMSLAAKEGKPVAGVFRDTWKAIKEAPTNDAALNIATKVFGARGAANLTDQIRSGKLDFNSLVTTIKNGSNTIGGTAAATASFGTKWKIFLNQMRVDLEPVATKVFGFATELLTKLGPAFSALGRFLQPAKEAIQLFIGAFQGKFVEGSTASWQGSIVLLGTKVRELWDRMQPFIQWLEAHWKPIFIAAGLAILAITAPVVLVIGALVYAWVRFQWFRDAVVAVFEFIRNKVIPVIATIVSTIITQFQHAVEWVRRNWPAIQEAITHVVNVIRDVITPILLAIRFLWEHTHNQIFAVVKLVWGFIRSTIEAVMNVIRGVINIVLGLINGDWSRVWDGIKSVFVGVWDAIKAEVQFAIGFVQQQISTVLSVISGIWSNVWSAISGFLSSIWNTMIGIVTGAIDTVIGFFAALPGRALGALASLGSLIAGAFTSAFSYLGGVISSGIDGVVGFFEALPGRIGSAISQLGGALLSGFKTAWNWFADHTGIHFGGVDILGDHIGAFDLTLPHLHSGGVVPGRTGQEVLAVLQAGEKVQSISEVNRQQHGPTAALHVENAYFGSDKVLPDLDWFARTRLAGV